MNSRIMFIGAANVGKSTFKNLFPKKDVTTEEFTYHDETSLNNEALIEAIKKAHLIYLVHDPLQENSSEVINKLHQLVQNNKNEDCICEL